jgi:hypothetical protein
MPLRPGTNLSIKDSPPPPQLPTDTGQIFLVGITERGPLAPVLTRNPTDWTTQLGVRNTNTAVVADAAEFLFKEGAKKIYTSRVVGPGAVTASIAVTDSGAATVFTAKAKGPGAYGNDLNIVVRSNPQDATIPVGSFILRVQSDAAVILEESPVLLDKAAAEYWMDTQSVYLTYTDGASANDPNYGATFALAGGNDDIAGITDAQWQAAIDKLTLDLGSGIVIAPGRTSDTGHIQIKTHVEANNRVGFLDSPDTATIATITASAAAVRSRFCGMFWPWVRVTGLVGTSTPRTVPPSVIAAGIAARNDALGFSPNKAAAGDLGVSKTAIGLSQDNSVVTDANHQTLNAAGVNVIRSRFGVFKVMGYRTTSSEATDPRWVNLGSSRLICAIRNGAWLVGERFLFDEIDGKGVLIGQFAAAISGEVLMPYYLAGSLYGDTPDKAFRVDTSSNTATTAANRQLLADIVVVTSEFGEEIDISVAKNLITEGAS